MGLVERLRFTEEHGIFDAANDDKHVTYTELRVALEAAEAMAEAIERMGVPGAPSWAIICADNALAKFRETMK